MNPPRAAIAAVLLATAAACAVTRPTAPQDVIKVAGDSHTVIFENDRVRVLSVHFKPGQVAPMHSHPDNVSYFITGGNLKITMADGKTIERNPKAGTAAWSDAVTHEAQNIGPSDYQQIQIELKPTK